jgi:hypothetical protein
LRADALISLAQLCWWLGKFTEARCHGQEAMAIAEELEDGGLKASAAMVLSYAMGRWATCQGPVDMPKMRFALPETPPTSLRPERRVGSPRPDFTFVFGPTWHARSRVSKNELGHGAAFPRSILPARSSLVAPSASPKSPSPRRSGGVGVRMAARMAAALAVETRSRYIGHHVIETLRGTLARLAKGVARCALCSAASGILR